MKNRIIRAVFAVIIVFGWFIIPSSASAAEVEVFTVKTCSLVMDNVDTYACFVGVSQHGRTDVICMRRDSKSWRNAMRLREGDKIHKIANLMSVDYEFEFIKQSDDPCVHNIK